MGLKEFLVSARAALDELSSYTSIHLVIGNESCDLDSTISAITYAYFLHKISPSGTLHLPVLNLTRHQFRLRLEVLYLLRRHQLTTDHLIFLDDLDLVSLASRAREQLHLTVTLVDYHQLSKADQCLEDFVVEVLDHRPQAADLPDSWNAQIEKVGSCCTLVARKLLNSESFKVDATVAELLLGTILVDTWNLSVLDGVGTPADQQVVTQLKVLLPPDFSAGDIYEGIKNAKFDLSSLSVLEMLYKDLKVLKGTPFPIATPSVAFPLQDVLARPEFLTDCQQFCSLEKADVLIILAFWRDDSGDVHRGIAVFSTNTAYREQVSGILLQSQSPNLNLQPISSFNSTDHVDAYIQNNIKVSRKGIVPILLEKFTNENHNASTAQALNHSEPSSTLENLNENRKQRLELVKAFQSDQFRTSQDLAALGMSSMLSPSLSSDSEFSSSDSRLGESTGIQVTAHDSFTPPDPDLAGQIDNQNGAGNAHDLDALAGDSGELVTETGATHTDLMDFGFEDSSINYLPQNLLPAENVGVLKGVWQGGSGDDLLVHSNVGLVQDTKQLEENNLFWSDLETEPSTEVEVSVSHDTNTVDLIMPANEQDQYGFSKEVFQSQSPALNFNPTNSNDTAAELSWQSNQASGQGSKLPSYPETPPNSCMEPSSALFNKETQLPSFNSSEMVRRIQEKKAALAGYSKKQKMQDVYDDNMDDDDTLDDLLVGSELSSAGGGSLISPAVPQNSYVELAAGFGFQSSGHQLPQLISTDITDRVNEKRSQFEWSVESLDGSTSGVDVGGNSEEAAAKVLGDSEDVRHMSVYGDDHQVPYTPQNSFVEERFDTYARSNLPSLNNAEIVAKIKAKQSAMFGSGSSSRVSRSSHGSDDSGGCRSPDVAEKSPRGANNLDSPQAPYTPQNSFRDSLGLLESRNHLPDLNEVAERLSTEPVLKRQFVKRSTSNSGGGSRDEENVNPIIHQLGPRRFGRNSSSQSDSQNTMSDVESLMSVSTDVGTPSENIMAAGIASHMRNEIFFLSRKDTNDSDVFPANKVEDLVHADKDFHTSKVSFTERVSSEMGGSSTVGETEPDDVTCDVQSTQVLANGYPEIKELFSPVSSDNIQSMEDHALYAAAESIVAQSVAAAVEFSQTKSSTEGGLRESQFKLNEGAHIDANNSNLHVDYTDQGRESGDDEEEDNEKDDETTENGRDSFSLGGQVKIAAETTVISSSFPEDKSTESVLNSLLIQKHVEQERKLPSYSLGTLDCEADPAALARLPSLPEPVLDSPADHSQVKLPTQPEPVPNTLTDHSQVKLLTQPEPVLDSLADHSQVKLPTQPEPVPDTLTDHSKVKLPTQPEPVPDTLTDHSQVKLPTQPEPVPDTLTDHSQVKLPTQPEPVLDSLADHSQAIILGAPAGDQTIADIALHELAFELTQELIQNALKDFPSTASTQVSDLSSTASTEVDEVGMEELVKQADTLNLEYQENRVFNIFMEDSEKSNEHVLNVSGNNPNIMKTETDWLKDAESGVREAELAQGNVHETTGSSDTNLPADLILSLTTSSPSQSLDTEANVLDMTWSKDSSMTILEDEVVTSFPERKTSSELTFAETEEEIINSFPGRKFSKSEEYPNRRFSKDDLLSRRSSKLEDSDLEVNIRPEDVETDYLPSMDPLQGNLDIIDASYSKITDADREVVEGESFRKASSEDFVEEAVGSGDEDRGRERECEDYDYETSDRDSREVEEDLFGKELEAKDFFHKPKIALVNSPTIIIESVSSEDLSEDNILTENISAESDNAGNDLVLNDDASDKQVIHESSENQGANKEETLSFLTDGSIDSDQVILQTTDDFSNHIHKNEMIPLGEPFMAPVRLNRTASHSSTEDSLSGAGELEVTQSNPVSETSLDILDADSNNSQIVSSIASVADNTNEVDFSLYHTMDQTDAHMLDAQKGNKQKKKIHVSFSEDLDDEVGDFNIVSSSRSSLKSPPPLPLSGDSDSSTSSSPAPEDNMIPPERSEIFTSPTPAETPLQSDPNQLQKRREVYHTSAGRISIATTGEEDESGHTNIQSPFSPNQVLLNERSQVGDIIQSAEGAISEADHQLDVSVSPSPVSLDVLASPSPVSLDVLASPSPISPDSSHTSKLEEAGLATQLPVNLATELSWGNSHPPADSEILVSQDTTDPSVASLSEVSPSIPDNAVRPSGPFIPGTADGTPATLLVSTVDTLTTDLLASSPTHIRNLSSASNSSFQGAVYSEEWQDDDIVEVAAQSGLEAATSASLRKTVDPDDITPAADNDVDGDEAGARKEEDDDSDAGDLEWENDTPVKTPTRPGIEPVLSAETTPQPIQRWKRVSLSGTDFDIDLQAVEPFKNVLSHGGYYDEGLSAIIVFYGCNLPSRRQPDYTYIMDHLFHYVIHTLEELVADDYVVIYFHGSTPRRQMPGLSWLRKCYHSIDRRLKKNLKGLFLVHPTIWLRTIVTMTKPFISSKFSSKLKFVRTLEELNALVPLQNVSIPEVIVHYDIHHQHLPTPPASPQRSSSIY